MDIFNLIDGIAQENDNSNKIDKKYAYEQVSIIDIKKLAILKYGSYGNIGKAFGVGQRRAWHILNGYFPPKSPNLIKRIADVLNIDAVILTKIFDSVAPKEKVSLDKHQEGAIKK